MSDESEHERQPTPAIKEAREGLERLKTLREETEQAIKLTEQYIDGEATIADLEEFHEQTEVFKKL